MSCISSNRQYDYFPKLRLLYMFHRQTTKSENQRHGENFMGLKNSEHACTKRSVQFFKIESHGSLNGKLVKRMALSYSCRTRRPSTLCAHVLYNKGCNAHRRIAASILRSTFPTQFYFATATYLPGGQRIRF